MADNTQRLGTSTQIRNVYSDGMSYINMKFFNTNMSFQFTPFISKDATGRSTYDTQKSLMTTINFEGAFAIYNVANDIINNKIKEVILVIPCAGGASLTLDRKINNIGQMETLFIISKNNNSIPFKFKTHTMQIKENGQMTPMIIESGLGMLVKTIEGYLTGINADRHLDKLTEDFIKSKEGQEKGSNNSYQSGTGGYQNNYKKPYNNNRKPYNNNYGNNQQYNVQPNQQNMSSYQIPGN